MSAPQVLDSQREIVWQINAQPLAQASRKTSKKQTSQAHNFIEKSFQEMAERFQKRMDDLEEELQKLKAENAALREQFFPKIEE